MSSSPLETSASSPQTLPVLDWTHRLTQLGTRFFTPLQPTPVAAPRWAARNEALRTELGWPTDLFENDHLQAFAGNALMVGSQPLATVYSGHQFGQWAGQLGDGRAIWLGEAASDQGPQEIQLKGAGRTPYSRGGDGRAVLRSSIREYLCSEAMHGLGIPTTRALCLVASPEPVRRETMETAAIVARVAPSFLRFGHFEHFSAQGDTDSLRILADHAISHHLPECKDRAALWQGNVYAALLDEVQERTARLLAQWQARVGKRADLAAWNAQIDTWRARKGFAYRQSGEVIKPQYAVERLYGIVLPAALDTTRDRQRIGVERLPAMLEHPARQRNVGRHHDVAGLDLLDDPVVRRVRAIGHVDIADHRVAGRA